MAKTKLKDIIVLLPGITGSVLKKGDIDLWATDASSIWNGVKDWDSLTEQLSMHGNDDGQDDIGDGVSPNGLIRDCHIIPGLVKFDGYNRLVDMLRKYFDVVSCPSDGSSTGNLVEFAYDWRRDNRVSARRLQVLIDKVLPAWRAYTGNPEARVILIAHSMGGLVSRYYLEVLQGWKDCRALITFGTPFHGALGALNYLANGYNLGFFDISKLARSCLSTYQLLPTYCAIKNGSNFVHVGDVPNLPNLRQDYVTNASKFHAEIAAAVKENSACADYNRSGYKLMPVVGAGQTTDQSAVWNERVLRVSSSLPEGLDPIFGEGDGTVPRISAIPEEWRSAGAENYIIERHGSLQVNNTVLNDIRRRIEQMQVPGLGPLRGGLAEMSMQIGIDLGLEEGYPRGEDIRVGARLVGADAKETFAGKLKLSIEAVRDNSVVFNDEKDIEAGLSFCVHGGLTSGFYRAIVRPSIEEANSPKPISDVFVVL